ncbi:hypothetical protein B296_00027779 [Ensete ventricosum]|uniref:Uncharacterized protein n=1 Tax=Ensete ventricosum TaxID=4639 RepID=A0A426Y6V1_ENSVE|nr:hypothetical protein B296_00027779 [Ensete ventricosum]
MSLPLQPTVATPFRSRYPCRQQPSIAATNCCLLLSHCRSPRWTVAALFLPPLPAAAFTAPFCLADPTFLQIQHRYCCSLQRRPSTPAICCLPFFPAASSALLLPPTPSSSPSAHSSAAFASCCRSASVPLSLLLPQSPPAMPSSSSSLYSHLSRNHPSPDPVACRTLLLPLLLPRRTLSLARTCCPSLLSASPQPLPLLYDANSCP